MKQVELFGQNILTEKPKRTPQGYDPLKGINQETKQDIFASFGPKKSDVPKEKSFEQIEQRQEPTFAMPTKQIPVTPKQAPSKMFQ